jgi:hypothetical protein
VSVMDLPRYQYVGVTSVGMKVAGTTLAADIAARIAEKYRVGWAELSVTTLADRREVGGIATVDGERVWWAEP